MVQIVPRPLRAGVVGERGLPTLGDLFVDLQELTYEEAAAAMDCPVGTVRSRLSRARQALRDALSEDRPGIAGAAVSLAKEMWHGRA